MQLGAFLPPKSHTIPYLVNIIFYFDCLGYFIVLFISEIFMMGDISFQHNGCFGVCFKANHYGKILLGQDDTTMLW